MELCSATRRGKRVSRLVLHILWINPALVPFLSVGAGSVFFMGHRAGYSPGPGRDTAAVAGCAARVIPELQDLAVRAAFGVSGGEVVADLVAACRLVAVVQAVYLNAVRAVAAYPETVGGGLSGRQAVLA